MRTPRQAGRGNKKQVQKSKLQKAGKGKETQMGCEQMKTRCTQTKGGKTDKDGKWRVKHDRTGNNLQNKTGNNYKPQTIQQVSDYKTDFTLNLVALELYFCSFKQRYLHRR